MLALVNGDRHLLLVSRAMLASIEGSAEGDKGSAEGDRHPRNASPKGDRHQRNASLHEW